MAQRSVSAFKATKNSRYTANTSGDISSGDGSDMFEDTADSFLNITDGGTVSANVGIRVTPTAGIHIKTATSASMKFERDAVAGVYGFEQAATSFGLYDHTNSLYRIRVNGATVLLNETSGNVGVGTTPTARLHLAAGTATGSSAPLKLTTGTALTTPEDGALEYHSSHLYFTIGSTRYQLDQQASGATSGTYTPTFTSNLNLDSTPTASALTAKYVRLGNNVTVTLYANVDPTATGQYSFYVTLPIASNLTASTQLLGNGSSGGGDTAEILGDTTNDRASVTATTTSATTHSIYLTFTYEVV